MIFEFLANIAIMEMTIFVIIFVIYSQKWQFTMKVLKFLGIQPNQMAISSCIKNIQIYIL